MKGITAFLLLALICSNLKAQNESKLVVQAAADQTNSNPLIRLQDSNGNDLMSIHSDDVTNIFIGNMVARDNYDGSTNIGIGTRSLYANVYGSSNVAIGHESLYANTDGNDNIGIGYKSLRDCKGGRNVAIGANALSKIDGGSFNTAMGFWALRETITSNNNTAFGYQAGANFDNGYNNVFLGANVDVTGSDYYNVIAIGQGTIVDDVNRVRIGNTATTSYGGWAGWTNLSDGRYKSNIKEEVPGLDFILHLRPVTYHLEAISLSKALGENQGLEWDGQMKIALAEKEEILQTGFIAQEVEAAAKAIGYDFSGIDRPKNELGTYGLRYAEFVVPLAKAVQELAQENELLRDQNQLLQKNDDLLARQLAQIEAALGLSSEFVLLSQEKVFSIKRTEVNLDPD